MALLHPTDSQSPAAFLTVEVGSAANFSGSFSPDESPPRIITAGDGDGSRSGPTTTTTTTATAVTTQQTAQVVTNKSIAFSLPRAVEPSAKPAGPGKRAIAMRSASQSTCDPLSHNSAVDATSETPSVFSCPRRPPQRDRYYFHVDYAPKLKGDFAVTDAPKAQDEHHPLNTRGGSLFASFEFGCGGGAFDADSSVGTSSFGGDVVPEPRKPPRHLRPAEMALVSATPAPTVAAAAAAGSSLAGGSNLNASFSTVSGTATPSPFDAGRNPRGVHFGQGSGGSATPRSHSASSIPSSAPDANPSAATGAAYIVAEKDVLRPRGWSLTGEPSPMPNSEDLRREVRNREIAGARSGLDATREERAKIRLGLVPGAASASGQRGPALSTDPGQAMHFRAIRERQRRTDEAREESHRARVDDGAAALQRVQHLLKEEASRTATGARMARPRPSLALVRHLQTADASSHAQHHQGTTASGVDAAVGRLRGSVRESDTAVADSAGLLRLVIATDMAARPEGGRPSPAEAAEEGTAEPTSLAASLSAPRHHHGDRLLAESRNLSDLHRRTTSGAGRAQRGGGAGNSIAAIRRASAPGRTFDPELEAHAVEAIGQEETQERGRVEREERRVFAEEMAKPFARFHTTVVAAVAAVEAHFERFQASHVPWVPIGAALDAEPGGGGDGGGDGGGSVARSRAQSRVGSRLPSRAGSRAGSRAVSRQGSFGAAASADSALGQPQPIQAGMSSINTTREVHERRHSAVDAMAAAIGRLGEPDAGGAVKGAPKPAEPLGRSGRVVAVFSPQGGGATPHHISRKKDEMSAALVANHEELRRARAAAFLGGPAMDDERDGDDASNAGETFAEQVARLNSACLGRLPRGDSAASTSKGQSFGAAIASVGDTSPSQDEQDERAAFGAGGGDGCGSPSMGASSSSSDLVQRIAPAQGASNKDNIRFVNTLQSFSAFGGGPSATPAVSPATTATVTPRKAELYELPGLAAIDKSPSPGFLQKRRGTAAPGEEEGPGGALGVGLPPSAASDSFMGRAAHNGTMHVRSAKLQRWVSGGGRLRWIDQIESRIAIDKAFLQVLHVIGSQLEDAAAAEASPKHAARFFRK